MLTINNLDTSSITTRTYNGWQPIAATDVPDNNFMVADGEPIAAVDWDNSRKIDIKWVMR